MTRGHNPDGSASGWLGQDESQPYTLKHAQSHAADPQHLTIAVALFTMSIEGLKQVVPALRLLHAAAPADPTNPAQASASLEFYLVAHAYMGKLLDALARNTMAANGMTSVVLQWRNGELDASHALRILHKLIVDTMDGRPFMDAIQRANVLRRELDEYKGIRAERDALREELTDQAERVETLQRQLDSARGELRAQARKQMEAPNNGHERT